MLRLGEEGSLGMTASSEQVVQFPAAGRPRILLEGVLMDPAVAEATASHPGIILCHPQPAASSMSDPLLTQLATDLARQGFIVLRFNFRGTGQSEGQQTDGRLEPLDIAGAVEFLLSQPQVNRDKICLAGHAFGGYVALAYAAHDPRIRTVVAVSPPVFRITPELGRFERPRFFVTGEFDEVAPRHKLESWIDQLTGPRTLRIVSNARHLMSGYEGIASETIVRYLTRWASTPGV